MEGSHDKPCIKHDKTVWKNNAPFHEHLQIIWGIWILDSNLTNFFISTASFHTCKNTVNGTPLGTIHKCDVKSAINIFNFSVGIDGPKESSFILLQAGFRCHVYCILLRSYLLALNHFSICTLVAKDIRRPYISVTTSLHSRSEDTNSLALRGGPRKPPLANGSKFCPNKTTSSESSVGVAAKVISAEFVYFPPYYFFRWSDF